MRKTTGGRAVDFKERYGPWAIIAGASFGPGRSFAKKIAAQGVSCILIANSGPLDEVAEEIRQESGVDCVTSRIDLSTPDAFAEIVALAGDREVGLYVANAGADPASSLFLDVELATWVKLLNVNVTTTMQACHHFGRRMRERGKGGILVTNSRAAYGGNSYLTVYCAVKGFLLNFCEGLWAELRPHGVHVLSLVLDQTDTPTFRGILERLGMPMSPDIATPDHVAETGLARLAHGPVHNVDLADAEAAPAAPSARSRRDRVVEIDKFVLSLYGKSPAA
jgi:short-subunit dehydrogenase